MADAEIIQDHLALTEEHVLQIDQRVDAVEEQSAEAATLQEQMAQCLERIEQQQTTIQTCLERIEAMETASQAQLSEIAAEVEQATSAAETAAVIAAAAEVQETEEEMPEEPPVEDVSVPPEPEPTEEPQSKGSFWERLFGGV